MPLLVAVLGPALSGRAIQLTVKGLIIGVRITLAVERLADYFARLDVVIVGLFGIWSLFVILVQKHLIDLHRLFLHT